MRRAIKRSHRSENRGAARKQNPQMLEANPSPAEAKLPGPELVEPESVESESPAPVPKRWSFPSTPRPALDSPVRADLR
jgi:hypothetical protein